MLRISIFKVFHVNKRISGNQYPYLDEILLIKESLSWLIASSFNFLRIFALIFLVGDLLSISFSFSFSSFNNYCITFLLLFILSIFPKRSVFVALIFKLFSEIILTLPFSRNLFVYKIFIFFWFILSCISFIIPYSYSALLSNLL